MCRRERMRVHIFHSGCEIAFEDMKNTSVRVIISVESKKMFEMKLQL